MSSDDRRADITIAGNETLGEASSDEAASSTVQLRRGQLIGRYVALTLLGTGAMGVVWDAYDPELDRKLAIKLLKARGRDPSAARARLQREAQALARLDHPNVVTVHDVGVHAEQLFVAMEHVAGRTMSAWLRETETPRPWREVVRVFVEAGRGLAAAHAAGLVHRDFKPDNVMIGDDGRVRVMDFGLARAELQESGSEAASGGSTLTSKLTQTGALMGTPAYMSAEHLEGREVDARSDQFSFCVALYEALYGERPFVAQTLAQQLAAVSEAEIRDAPRGSSVPGWLRQIVVRGLAADPQRRWPSMRALLDALADDPASRRRRRGAALAVLGLLAGGVWALASLPDEPEARACTGMDAKLDGVWDAGRRAEVEAALLATKLSYAPDTWARVEQHLDGYAHDWVAARVQACEATLRGEQSSELLDLRMACLDERFGQLRATVDELTQADATTVEKAVQAVLELPRLDRCADIDALRAALPPPEDPELAARVRSLDEQLLTAAGKQSLGRYDEAIALVSAVVIEAEQLDYEPLRARAWLRLGTLQELQGDFEAAEATLARAHAASLAQRMHDEAARAAILSMFVTGLRLARPEDARRWAVHAEPLARAARVDELRARYFYTLGVVARVQGEYDEARGHHERGLAIREQVLGSNHLDVATSLNGLGNTLQEQGKFDEARECLLRALAIREQVLGAEHPHVANTLSNLGSIAGAQGRFAESRDYLERALAVAERALGPDHPQVALILSNLGITVHSLGDVDAAGEYLERALASYERMLGPDHPELAQPLHSLSSLAFAEGDYAKARSYSERALTIWEAALGSDHPDLAYPISSLGEIAHATGDHALARAHHARALAIREAALGPDHPEVATSSTSLGQVLVDANEPALAIAQLERALAIRSANEGDPLLLVETRWPLARALWDAPEGQGRDRPRARELAELARVGASEAGERGQELLAEIDAWLPAPAN